MCGECYRWQQIFDGMAQRKHEPSAWQRRDINAKCSALANNQRYREAVRIIHPKKDSGRPVTDDLCDSLAKKLNSKSKETEEAKWNRKCNSIASNNRKRMRRKALQAKQLKHNLIDSKDAVSIQELN